MIDIKHIALAGATGNLGTSIMNVLLESGDFVVTVLKRAGSESTFSTPVQIVDVDYGSLEQLTVALRGQDAVVCTFGMGTDASVHRQIIDAAVAAKVKHFIPSEFSFDIKNKLVRQLPIFENKLKVICYLEERTYDSEMTYTYVINSAFLDWGFQHNFILDISKNKPTIFGSGDELFSTTTVSTTAKAVLGVLKNYEKTKNRAVYIHDAVVSQNILLGIVRKHTPGKLWKPVHVDLEQLKVDSDSKLERGTYDMSTLYSYLCVALFSNGYGSRLETTDNDLFGIKEMTHSKIEDIVRAHLSSDSH